MTSGKLIAAWILASASPRRQEILQNLGLRFTVHPSTAPEPKRLKRETPSRYVARCAETKALAVAGSYPLGYVIAADTVVATDHTIMGKPANYNDARKMLRQLNGQWHEVVTGLCLYVATGDKPRIYTSATTSRVHFRRLSASDITWYLNTGEYRDKAGAYGIQGYASLFIDRIEGCYFNIVGFPVAAFAALCRRASIALPNYLTGFSDAAPAMDFNGGVKLRNT